MGHAPNAMGYPPPFGDFRLQDLAHDIGVSPYVRIMEKEIRVAYSPVAQTVSFDPDPRVDR
jgi:hypothetical protein